MTDNDTLSPKQRRFIGALLQARNIREAAQLAQIGERTAWRWLAEPGVKGELSARLDGMMTQVTSGAVSDMGEARAFLLAIMRSRTARDGDRVRAAGMILDGAMRLFELLALAERVARLEQRLTRE